MSLDAAVPVAAPAAGRGRLALWTIAGAQLLFLLDATIVNIALPQIQSGLGFSDTERQVMLERRQGDRASADA